MAIFGLRGVGQDCGYVQSGTELVGLVGGPDLSAVNTVCSQAATGYTTVSNTADAIKRVAGCGVPGIRTSCGCTTGSGLKTCKADGSWGACACPKPVAAPAPAPAPKPVAVPVRATTPAQVVAAAQPAALKPLVPHITPKPTPAKPFNWPLLLGVAAVGSAIALWRIK